MTTLNPPRILITGFGLISPLGHSAWETFTALLAGKTIADRVAALPEEIGPVDLVRSVGSVSVVQHASVDPAIDLAERAAREAMYMAGIDRADELEGIVGTSKGAMHALTKALEPSPFLGRGQGEGLPHHGRKDPHPSPLPKKGEGVNVIALGPHAYLAHHLRRRLDLGNLTSTVAACASGLTALHQARQLLQAADAPRRLLVVSSEASLLPMFIHSYDRLGVLPPLTPTPAPGSPGSYRGLPLDQRRRGFMLAEVGAAVILERADALCQSPIPNSKSELELLDTAIAAEAYDLIRTNPNLPALAHVARQLFAGRAIDVIHPHATGTLDHDPAELNIYASLQPAMPHIYANKGALGHTLGASGLVSLVLACLCAKTSRVPPMPWLTQPIDGPFRLGAEAKKLPPRSTHGIFAAGFGGHVAGAIIAI